MNTLITTVGRCSDDICLLKEELGDSCKVFAANSEIENSLLKADGYVLTPLNFDKSYVDFVASYCKKTDIKVIISCIDVGLVVLAKNKEYFKQHGITALVSDESIIRLCNDKWKCYHFLLSLGLKQPRTYIDINLLRNDLQCDMVSFPLIFKPRWGFASIGVYQVDSLEELDIIYRKVHRTIFNDYLKYESAQDKDFCVLMQEKIKGDEYGIDILNDLNGNYVAYAAKRKMMMYDGSTQMAQTIRDSKFEVTAKTISLNLKHIGNLDVDCFLTESGEIVILELNCRFGGQYPFVHLAGARFIKQIFEWLSGNPTSEKYIAYKAGVTGYKDYPQVVRFLE